MPPPFPQPRLRSLFPSGQTMPTTSLLCELRGPPKSHPGLHHPPEKGLRNADGPSPAADTSGRASPSPSLRFVHPQTPPSNSSPTLPRSSSFGSSGSEHRPLLLPAVPAKPPPQTETWLRTWLSTWLRRGGSSGLGDSAAQARVGLEQAAAGEPAGPRGRAGPRRARCRPARCDAAGQV